MKAIRCAALVAVVALACAALAYAKPTTISVDGVDHGDGTASYSGKLSAAKDCVKGVKITLTGTPPPKKLGSDKTNKHGKFSFNGAAPEGDLQRIYVEVGKKGDCPSGTLFHLTYAEVFGG